MAEANKTALQLLEELRREREEINVLIRGLEKRLGIVDAAPSDTAVSETAARVTLSIDSIPVGFFHNLSQAAAAEKLLRMNPGQPLTTSEILESFRKSGMTLGSKNAVTVLYTALKRSSKFERVAGKAWGLSEWYPERRKRSPDERLLPPSDKLPDHNTAFDSEEEK